MSLVYLYLLLLLLLLLACCTQAQVPSSNQFRYVNRGEFHDYGVEYGGYHRVIYKFWTFPFVLCFHSPAANDKYYLAMRMGRSKGEERMRWVWEANRGNPVGENATLSLGRDGNLVLANADGRIVWQTKTANKGVVGLQVLRNGNMVLHDSNGRFIWQSFDFPTDTLLVGQSLRIGTATRLVSRASFQNNVDGPYSLVMEPKSLAFYYNGENSPKPLKYSDLVAPVYSTINGVRLEANLTFSVKEPSDPDFRDAITLRSPKYNTTFSYLRLEIDGNLQVHTYDLAEIDGDRWEVTYSYFSEDKDIQREEGVDECQLPSRCGNFGLCEDNQCVGCPTPKGLLAWSKNCKQPKVTSCQTNDIRYYKLGRVDHFMVRYNKGEGPMKQDACRNKCSKDCKCLGYFFHEDSSLCWIAHDLQTLAKVENSKHTAYIKVLN